MKPSVPGTEDSLVSEIEVSPPSNAATPHREEARTSASFEGWVADSPPNAATSSQQVDSGGDHKFLT